MTLPPPATGTPEQANALPEQANKTGAPVMTRPCGMPGNHNSQLPQPQNPPITRKTKPDALPAARSAARHAPSRDGRWYPYAPLQKTVCRPPAQTTPPEQPTRLPAPNCKRRASRGRSTSHESGRQPDARQSAQRSDRRSRQAWKEQQPEVPPSGQTREREGRRANRSAAKTRPAQWSTTQALPAPGRAEIPCPATIPQRSATPKRPATRDA
jgi:hypothetical protein